MNWTIVIILLLSGYFVGGWYEKKHYKSILARERALSHILIQSAKYAGKIPVGSRVMIVTGATVVASDYFKTFAGQLKSIFGGQIKSYEFLLDRGRREAILRMKERAHAWGAQEIVNVRTETSTINEAQGRSSMPIIEVLSYGTAVKKA